MRKKTLSLLVNLLIMGNMAFGQKATISGYVDLDSTWVKKVYISLISDFNQMYTASNKLIVAEAVIDSSGYFKTAFPTSESQSLYRLHIIKNGDPISTLIIGSREENHVFFIGCARVPEPPGGFGPAAVRVARAFRHSSTLADGRDATGSPVNLRVLFRIDDTTRRG